MCVVFFPPPHYNLGQEPALSVSLKVVGFGACLERFLKHAGTTFRNTLLGPKGFLEIPAQTDLNYVTPLLSMCSHNCWEIKTACTHTVVESSAHVFWVGGFIPLGRIQSRGKELATTTILARVGYKSKNSL